MEPGNDNPWFATWFDHPLYHILYKNRDQREADLFVNNLAKYLKLKAGSFVLDLACGKGRHAITFHRLGFRVLGVDLSAQSIAAASENTQQGCDFLIHDMRFPLPDISFDAIFNLFTSFGYFENDSDNDRVLSSVTKNLNPDGIFVMDYLNAQKAIAHLVREEQLEKDNITFHIKRYVSNDGFIIKEIETMWEGRSYHFKEQVRAFSRNDLDRLFRRNRLVINEVFGDYYLNSFDPAQSDRLILMASHR